MINWVDIVVLLILLIYVSFEFFRGFLKLITELAGTIVSLFGAFWLFPFLAKLVENIGFLKNYENYVPIGCFLFIWLALILIIDLVIRIVFSHIELDSKQKKIDRSFGVIPAFIKGVVFVAIILSLTSILPIKTDIGLAIENSYFASRLANFVLRSENKLAAIKNLNESLVNPNHVLITEETTQLGFKVLDADMNVNPIAESAIFALTNQERIKAGLLSLTLDPMASEVARAQSRDMLKRGYFSHYTPEGKTPYDRLMDGKILFRESGENLALAPTIEQAHAGLMNSPKHKANILSKDYSRVGIGVIDAGKYGFMVTEDFVR